MKSDLPIRWSSFRHQRRVRLGASWDLQAYLLLGSFDFGVHLDFVGELSGVGEESQDVVVEVTES